MAKKDPVKKTTLFLAGSVALVAGIMMVLAWWPSVVTLFKGVIGMVLAVGGLVMLYMTRSEA